MRSFSEFPRGRCRSARIRRTHLPCGVPQPYNPRVIIGLDNARRRARRTLTADVRSLSIALISVFFSGCHTARDSLGTQDEIRTLLDSQAMAWNAGNIEAFMEPYWQSPDLTFSSGGKVTRGWDDTMAGYKARYPTRDAMGQLAFDAIEVLPKGRDVALVLGRWHLERAEPVGGAFTLVMRKDSGRWVIVHDHTSRDAP